MSHENNKSELTPVYRELIVRITKGGTSMDARLASALQSAPRVWFVPKRFRRDIAVDAPLPIPGGQTNSQPTTVVIMLRELSPALGDRVLDVGFGSGWTTCLLSQLVGNAGRIYGIEVNPDTYAFGVENIEHYLAALSQNNITLLFGDGTKGWREQAPFQRILVSAGAPTVPPDLLSQLADQGRMVIPVDELDGSQSICIIDKQKDGSFSERRLHGFLFVPLIQ
ncbi:MAG: protein-L-isoaspartate O-methyltransferase [Patescibacteria group bacterium]